MNVSIERTFLGERDFENKKSSDTFRHQFRKVLSFSFDR